MKGWQGFLEGSGWVRNMNHVYSYQPPTPPKHQDGQPWVILCDQRPASFSCCMCVLASGLHFASGPPSSPEFRYCSELTLSLAWIRCLSIGDHYRRSFVMLPWSYPEYSTVSSKLHYILYQCSLHLFAEYRSIFLQGFTS